MKIPTLVVYVWEGHWRFRFNQSAMKALDLYNRFGVDLVQLSDGVIVTSDKDIYSVHITVNGGGFSRKTLATDLDLLGKYVLQPTPKEYQFLLKKYEKGK